jgi:FecR protein
MKARSIVLICAGILLVCAGLPGTAAADSSHIRIIRLSLVQGDVRFASSFHGDPLTDTKAVWQTAALNMPIREGSALATGTGRAEVEFENGAMAFLSENSVLEFYDLSLHDGEKITRLVLRQGSAIFYTHSQTGDYFSVTGGDFTVEAGVRSRFRLNNFDDGSTVDVEGGQVSVLRDEKSTPLEKGQSLSVRASDPKNQVIARADTTDDFDRWVSGRIDSVVTATNYTNQFTSTTNYTSGFSDLYTFGSWLSMPGYGYGWRPFGVGLGWCPFDAAYGNWYMDASIGGWSFIGSAPWGWLPYHYGGWIYAPAYGWMWTPNGFGGAGGRPITYRPVTAVWVNTGGALGFVPAHPLDKSGKTPVNITRGVYPVEGNTIASPVAVANGEKVSVVKHLPANALVAGNVASTTAPVPVSRVLPASTFTTRPAGPGIVRQSSIMYDPAEHRFVNSGQVAAAANAVAQPRSNVAKVNEATAGRGALPPGRGALPPVRATTSVPTAGHNSVPARPAMTPAPARVAGGSSGGSSSGGGWGGGRSSASSAGSSMPASSAGSSRPSSAGGGGRPH